MDRMEITFRDNRPSLKVSGARGISPDAGFFSFFTVEDGVRQDFMFPMDTITSVIITEVNYEE